MKCSKRVRNWKVAASGLLALFVSLGLGRAQLIVNGFDTASEVSQWRFDYGINTTTWTFDATRDANGNPNSGSMRVDIPFSSALGGNNKAALTTDRWFPGINGASFTSLQFDIRIDPSSAPDAFGLNGFFSMAIRNTDSYNYIGEFNDNVGVSWMTNMPNGWRHVVVSPLVTPDDAIRALTFQLYGGPSQNINGDVIFNIDNIVFVPEPSTIALFGLGALGALVFRRRS